MGFFHTIFLFDGFRSVRASLFGNTLRGWVIIKSRLCREAAKVGGGQGPPVKIILAMNRREMCCFAFQSKSGSGKRSRDNATFGRNLHSTVFAWEKQAR